MLRDLYDRLEAHGVTDLIIGNLKHIRDNANHGRVGNQKLHNFWPLMQIRQRIQELGEEYGVHVRFKSERGTSKRCSVCGEKHENGRVRRGLYKCPDTNVRLNANVNGANNLLYGRKVAADRQQANGLASASTLELPGMAGVRSMRSMNLPTSVEERVKSLSVRHPIGSRSRNMGAII